VSSDSERQAPATGETGGPVLLMRVFNPVEAEIIMGKLRGAGIESFARHDALGVVYGLTVDGCGQQDIMVRAEDLAEARAVLEAAEEPDAENLGAEGETDEADGQD
jgi:hypothetical protein